MKLAELFAKKDPESETVGTDFGWIASKTVEGAKFSFNATKVRTDHWEVDFVKDGKHELTGDRNGIRVMSFVIDSFRQFVEKYNPKRIEFSAKSDEVSRISLYKKLLDRLGGKYYVQHHAGIGMGSAPKFDVFTLLLKPVESEK